MMLSLDQDSKERKRSPFSFGARNARLILQNIVAVIRVRKTNFDKGVEKGRVCPFSLSLKLKETCLFLVFGQDTIDSNGFAQKRILFGAGPVINRTSRFWSGNSTFTCTCKDIRQYFYFFKR